MGTRARPAFQDSLARRADGSSAPSSNSERKILIRESVGFPDREDTELLQGILDDVNHLVVALRVRGLEKESRFNQVMEGVVDNAFGRFVIVELHANPEALNPGVGMKEFVIIYLTQG